MKLILSTLCLYVMAGKNDSRRFRISSKPVKITQKFIGVRQNCVNITCRHSKVKSKMLSTNLDIYSMFLRENKTIILWAFDT